MRQKILFLTFKWHGIGRRQRCVRPSCRLALGLAEDLRKIDEVRSNVGMVFQHFNVRYLSLPDPSHLETLLAQHVAIFEAVETGDPKQVGQRMTAHLREVLRTVQHINSTRPDLFG